MCNKFISKKQTNNLIIENMIMYNMGHYKFTHTLLTQVHDSECKPHATFFSREKGCINFVNYKKMVRISYHN